MQQFERIMKSGAENKEAAQQGGASNLPEEALTQIFQVPSFASKH